MSKYPLLVMFALLMLTAILRWVDPILFNFGFTGIVAGIVLLVAGAVLVLVTAGIFRKRGTPVDPTKPPEQLVTNGLYRLSRNPMYVGMLLVLFGFPLIVSSLLSLVSPIIFFFYMNIMLIPREEIMIEKSFGDVFRAYKIRTRRWL